MRTLFSVKMASCRVCQRKDEKANADKKKNKQKKQQSHQKKKKSQPKKKEDDDHEQEAEEENNAGDVCMHCGDTGLLPQR